jgi:DNA-binding MarR family transcriptional regulator
MRVTFTGADCGLAARLNMRPESLSLNKFPEGNKLFLDQKAQIIEAAAKAQCGVRDIAQRLTCKTSRVIALLKEMEEERLIEARPASCSKRGRPKKVIACTSLGLELLEAYRKAAMKPLRAKKADLERAAKDAVYAERLATRGLSPFSLFMELNTIARNIEVSSEASETVGRA